MPRTRRESLLINDKGCLFDWLVDVPRPSDKKNNNDKELQKRLDDILRALHMNRNRARQ